MSKHLESLKEKLKGLGYLSPISNDVAEHIRHLVVTQEIVEEQARIIEELTKRLGEYDQNQSK